MIFKDFPDFQPNISPKQMFMYGIVGGTYFRKITSPTTNKTYQNHYKKIKFLNNINKNNIINNIYNKNINYYKCKVGSSYEYWCMKNWINEKYDPYGWIEWYCNFYLGRRTPDDKRQINRWKAIAGINGRFRKMLENKIKKDKTKKYNKLKQTLLQWGVFYEFL